MTDIKLIEDYTPSEGQIASDAEYLQYLVNTMLAELAQRFTKRPLADVITAAREQYNWPLMTPDEQAAFERAKSVDVARAAVGDAIGAFDGARDGRAAQVRQSGIRI